MPDLIEIERDLATERVALRGQVRAVGDALDPARMVESATGHLNADAALRAIGPAMQSPKLPLAVTGLGLSWLFAQWINAAPAKKAKPAFADSDAPSAPGLRQTDPTGRDMAEFDARIAAADAATSGRFGTETFDGENDMSHSEPTSSNSTLRARAYASVDVLRSTLDDGLDKLPDGAKARIRAAREAAIDAHGQAEHHARQAAQAARRTAHDNPLLMGVVALAAGAALAAALPRTSVENRTIGAHRDRLFDEADRVFHEEVEKAKASAKQMVAEGQKQAKAAIGDAADSVSQTAEKVKSGEAKANGAARS
jgi:ElaB/YqjD/DUF883 family membrane-anchored ribosome-binding protein